jgi:hypothetical protein
MMADTAEVPRCRVTDCGDEAKAVIDRAGTLFMLPLCPRHLEEYIRRAANTEPKTYLRVLRPDGYVFVAGTAESLSRALRTIREVVEK